MRDMRFRYSIYAACLIGRPKTVFGTVSKNRTGKTQMKDIE